MISLEEAKEILENHNVWNSAGVVSAQIAKILKRPGLKDIILESTSFLPSNTIQPQRLYHILYNVIDVPLCDACNINPRVFSKHYERKSCSRECGYVLAGKHSSATKTFIDESGTSIAQRSTLLGAEVRRNTIDEVTGLTIQELSVLKTKITRSEIDEITGLNSYETAGIKQGITKTTIFNDEGLNIAQVGRYKAIETMRTTLDQETGYTLMQLFGKQHAQRLRNSASFKNSMIESGRVRKTTILDNGISIASNAAYLGAKKARITREANGSMVPRDQFSVLELYGNQVAKFTLMNKDLQKLENIELQGTWENDGWHIDHKVSTIEGFRNNIPPFIIGSIHNLEMLHWKDNLSKNRKCSITIEELCNTYYDKLNNENYYPFKVPRARNIK